MRRRSVTRTLALLVGPLVCVLVLTSCAGVTRGDESRDIHMLIPNSPGGGYDQTGRAAVDVMEELGTTGGTFDVTNIIGAGGSVAMTELMNEKGDENVMMTVGLGVVGSLYSFGNDYQAPGRHPLGPADRGVRRRPGPGGLAVQDDRRPGRPRGRRTRDEVVVGGGSSPGGPDHLFPMQLAGAIGIEPKEVRYITYDGGGPLTSALLGEKIQVGFSGLGEFDGSDRVRRPEGARRLRQGAARRPSCVKDVPTLTESDIDLVFVNWRGVLAPPGISDEASRRADRLPDRRCTTARSGRRR